MMAYSTVTIDTTTGPLEEASFPKVVICNSYKVRQSFFVTIFNKSVITNDDSGYELKELQQTFVNYFIKGFKEEENPVLKDKLNVVIEKYVQSEHFNETLLRECQSDTILFLHDSSI